MSARLSYRIRTHVKLVVIGSSDTIGSAAVRLLKRSHEILAVSRSIGDYRANVTDKALLVQTLGAIGNLDAIVSTRGTPYSNSLRRLADANVEKSLCDRLMGQVNVVRVRAEHIVPNGSITLTSGAPAQQPGSAT